MASSFAVIAHRGNSALAPENTMVAFEKALECVRAFELDAQLTADAVPIVLHDEKLGRVNDGPGGQSVADSTWHDLASLDAGAWFHPDFKGLCRIPQLRQVLDTFRGRAHIHLELKSTQEGLAQAVAAALHASGWVSDIQTTSRPTSGPPRSEAEQLLVVPGITITSFHVDQLKRSMALLPGIAHGWLVQTMDAPLIQEAATAGIAQLCPRTNACTAEAVAAARASGVVKSIRGWGVKTHDLLRHAVRCGMDGATVNWPHEALDVLAELASPKHAAATPG